MIVILTLVILGWPAGMNPLLDEAMRVAGNINVPKVSKKMINQFNQAYKKNVSIVFSLCMKLVYDSFP